MKLFAAVVLSLASLTAQAHWETDANFVGQHCELATASGPLRDFTVFYRLKNNVPLHVDRVDVQWDPALAAYTENDTFRKKVSDSETEEDVDLDSIRQVTHNATTNQTRIWIAATHFDLTIELRSDHEGGSAHVSFVSDGPVSKAHYRCDGVRFQ